MKKPCKILNYTICMISIILATCLFYEQANAATDSFMILSDIHFNPFSACRSSTQTCLLAKQLQAAPTTKWAHIFAKEDHTVPSTYDQETNPALLNSMLSYIKQLPQDNHFVM
ncbi:MAG: hypothetical protein ACK4PR_10950, partial [Gammaproteobacteria bacterium]